MDATTDLNAIHDASRNNRHAILAATRCGCFSCEAMFHSWEVSDWTDRDFSAICPRCHIDSVLPDRLPSSALNQALLRAMRVEYFEKSAAA